MIKILPLLLMPTLAFALHVQGPDDEDLADDQARMEEQANFYKQYNGDYARFREGAAGLSDRYEDKKRTRFEEAHGGTENFFHSWEESNPQGG